MAGVIDRDTMAEIQYISDAFSLREDAVDLFTEGDVLYGDLPKEKVPGGERIEWPLEVQLVVGGAYGPNDTFDTTRYEILNMAYQEWKDYYGMAVITERHIKQLAGGHNRFKRVQLVNSQLKSAKKRCMEDISTSLWRTTLGNTSYFTTAANTTDELQGLGDMLYNSTSQKYESITPTDTAFVEADGTYLWLPNQTTTTTTFTVAMLRTMRSTSSRSDNIEDYPTHYYMHPDVYNYYEGLLQSQQQFHDPKKAEAGFRALTFGTSTVRAALKCPADSSVYKVIALNMKYLYLISHKDDSFLRHEWKESELQPKATSRTTWMGNLICTNRRAHMVYTYVRIA